MRSKRYASARHLRPVIWREDREVALAGACSIRPVKWNKFAGACQSGGPAIDELGLR